MKKLLLWGMVACWAVVQAGAAEIQWTTDLAKAKEKAKAENKLVMINFTGSDWCGWCIKLKNEVFTKPEFVAYVEKNVVPVEIDFPRKKEQSAALKKANKELAAQYDIEGYPTVIVLNSNGEKVDTLGYDPKGPKSFIAKLDALKKK